MIRITTENLGKKYATNRLFKSLNLEFNQPGSYAITGINGSGKSTLLLCLAGFVTPTEGKITWTSSGKSIGDLHEQFAFASPAYELFEDLTLSEHLEFHTDFTKKFSLAKAKTDLERFGLLKAQHRQIKSFSSGMKQRLKLIMAFNNDVPVLFLDEPCSNLDEEGISLYQEKLRQIHGQKLLIIATNQLVTEFPLTGIKIDLHGILY